MQTEVVIEVDYMLVLKCHGYPEKQHDHRDESVDDFLHNPSDTSLITARGHVMLDPCCVLRPLADRICLGILRYDRIVARHVR